MSELMIHGVPVRMELQQLATISLELRETNLLLGSKRTALFCLDVGHFSI